MPVVRPLQVENVQDMEAGGRRRPFRLFDGGVRRVVDDIQAVAQAGVLARRVFQVERQLIPAGLIRQADGGFQRMS